MAKGIRLMASTDIAEQLLTVGLSVAELVTMLAALSWLAYLVIYEKESK